MENKKELLFSVTAKDCRFDFYRGTGKGGQKRNKTSSACRCTHIASGAVGQSEESRSQHKNKELAFLRMAETKKFKDWHKIEVAKVTGKIKEINDSVDLLMDESLIKVEINKNGVWIEEKENN